MGNSDSNENGALLVNYGLEQQRPNLGVKPLNSPAVFRIVGGASHNLALLTGGQVYAWGNNEYCQLGLASNIKVGFVPMPRVAINSLAVGANHSAVVSDTGALFTWGLGTDGQLGYAPSSKGMKRAGRDFYQESPTLVEAFKGIVVAKVSCGENFTIVLTNKHQVYSFGCGTHGALGTGVVISRTEPQLIAGLTDHIVVKVACGIRHCLALTIEGKVYTWGSPYSKVLPRQGSMLVPVLVDQIQHLECSDIACGETHSVVLVREPNIVLSWGGNDLGQLGYEFSDLHNSHVNFSPQQVPIEGHVQAIECGGDHTIAMLASGSVIGWGDNSEKQLGNKHPGGVVLRKLKKKGKAIVINCGYWHTNILIRQSEEDRDKPRHSENQTNRYSTQNHI